jgi:hypothetical protein
MLGHDCHNAHGHRVGFWKVSSHELDATIPQGHQKRRISGQAIQLGDHKDCARYAATIQCFG